MEKSCCNINRPLLPVKTHYFLFMAALACVLPFRTVFAKQLGISATAVGMIFCAVTFMKTVTNPLFGFLLDYFKRFRLILSITMIFVAISNVALVFIPPRSLTHQDEINSTERLFYYKLPHLLSNDTLQYLCRPKLILNIEYVLPQELADETNQFVCDMHCSKSINNVKSIGKESPCLLEMTSEFKIFVDVSNCDINIKVEKGQLGVYNKDSEDMWLFEVNNAFVRKLLTSIPSSTNCSSGQTKPMPLLSKNTENKETKFNNKYLPKVDTSEFPVKNLDSGVEKCFVQNEYIVNLYNKKYCMDLCSEEFDCQAKNCLLAAKRNEEKPEKFPVEENEFLTAQFWSFFVLTIISCSTSSALMFLMDAVCYELLQDRKDKYGLQRLWGTIGWGLGALIGGCVNQIVSSDPGVVNYAPSFILLGVIALIDLIPLYLLKVTDIKYSPNICKDVCLLFSKIDILYNIFIVYIIGVLSGFIWNYQFWFMEEIGSSQALLGLSQTFECLFELPCFFVSGWVIKKIGHSHCNSVTFLCFGLRYLCFAFMYNPWWTLAAGLLHGPTFGLFYASMTLYAKNKAPAGTEATVQSLLHLCFEGIGVATGSLLGGFGLDIFGCRTSFIYAAAMSFILLFVNVFASIIPSKIKRNKKPTQVFS